MARLPRMGEVSGTPTFAPGLERGDLGTGFPGGATGPPGDTDLLVKFEIGGSETPIQNTIVLRQDDDDEMSMQESSFLMKFLQGLAEWPKLDHGNGETRQERLAVWHLAVQTLLQPTLDVVVRWFAWAWATAERHYLEWVRLPPLQRRQKTVDGMPRKWQFIDNWFWCDFWLRILFA